MSHLLREHRTHMDHPQHGELRGAEASAYFEAIDREVTMARVMAQRTPLTWLMIGLNVALYAAAWLFGEFYLSRQLGLQSWAFNVGQLSFYTGMNVKALVASGEWWRLVSSAFVHMDMAHIIFNGYGLYAISPIIERFYGASRWGVIYLGSAVLSGLASFWFTGAISGGASGAVYGLVGAMLVLGYRDRRRLPERVARALTRGMLPWVVFGIGIGFLDFLPFDNAAHVGGLAAGGVLALLCGSMLTAPGRLTRARVMVARGVAVALTATTLFALATWAREVDRCTPSRDAYLSCYPDLEPLTGDPPRRAR